MVMAFSDQEYLEVIQNNTKVKNAYESIKEICINLQKDTDCPKEDIDYFLKYLAGKWSE